MTGILTWEEAVNTNTSQVGGKGLNLARLHKVGFKIPEGIIVTTDTYLRFIHYNKIEELIASASDLDEKLLTNKESLLLLESIQSAIELGEFPDNIVEEIESNLKKQNLLKTPLAVRSSAASEDSENFSFAGIHESFLDVIGLEDILTSIKRCFSSIWSLRAVSYRRTININDNEVLPAVVVMKLVDAKASGVAFTCHPLTGEKNKISIHANFGLGETLVSGDIDPDEYTVESLYLNPVITETKIGRKEKVLSRDEDTNRLRTVSNRTVNQQVLTEKEIIKLSRVLFRVFESIGHMDNHQDIEWAFDGNEFFLVQTRSITVISNRTYDEIKNEKITWSNANFKDVMPNVQSFLSWSIINAPLEQMVLTPLKMAGYPIKKEIPHTKLYNGRAYMNLTALQWEMYDSFNMKPENFNVALGGHQPEISAPKLEVKTFQKRFNRDLRKVKALIRMLRISIKAQSLFNGTKKRTNEARKQISSQLSLNDLIEMFNIYYKELVMYTPNAQALNTLSGFYFTTLESLLKKKYGQRTIGEINKLLQNRGKITSAEQGLELQRLAVIAKNDEYCITLINSSKLTGWESLPENSTFKKEFNNYLDIYGHRGSYELDISNSRWREEPVYLLNIIQQYLENEVESLEKSKVYPLNRRDFPLLKYLLARFLLDKTVKGFEKREEAKSVLAHLLEVIRLIVLEIGKRLVERNIIDRIDDVFQLGWYEILSISNQEWKGEGIRDLIRDRYKANHDNTKKDYPNLVIDDQPSFTSQNVSISQDGAKVLKGIGVSSGQITGTCRIVHTPLEAVSLNKNDILVTNSTDPSWTPVFLKVGGVVMETGGYLSHSAIVAREYGIPAVVNVPGVMSYLKDGQKITLDGNDGIVVLSKEKTKVKQS